MADENTPGQEPTEVPPPGPPSPNPPTKGPGGLPLPLAIGLGLLGGAAIAVGAVLILGGGGTDPITVEATDVPVEIPEEGTVSSEIEVSDGGEVSDLKVRIDDLEHEYMTDIAITLSGPDGTSVTLVGADSEAFPQDEGSLSNTVFDDAASEDIDPCSVPCSGSFRPESPLSAFDGDEREGTWTLEIDDPVGGDEGTLRGWSLEFGGSD